MVATTSTRYHCVVCHLPRRATFPGQVICRICQEQGRRHRVLVGCQRCQKRFFTTGTRDQHCRFCRTPRRRGEQDPPVHRLNWAFAVRDVTGESRLDEMVRLLEE